MSTNLFKRARAFLIFYQELDKWVNAHNHMSLCTLSDYSENWDSVLLIHFEQWWPFSHIYVAFVCFSLIHLNLTSLFSLPLIFLGNDVFEELHTPNCILKKPEWTLKGMQRYMISYTYYFNLCSYHWGPDFGGSCTHPHPCKRLCAVISKVTAGVYYSCVWNRDRKKAEIYCFVIQRDWSPFPREWPVISLPCPFVDSTFPSWSTFFTLVRWRNPTYQSFKM